MSGLLPATAARPRNFREYWRGVFVTSFSAGKEIDSKDADRPTDILSPACAFWAPSFVC